MLFEKLLLEAYPNPNRRGCPGTEKLRDLALHPKPVDDATAVHVRECSPCFAEFRHFRDTNRASERSRVKTKIAVASAVALVAAVALVMFRTSPTPLGAKAEVAELDFSSDPAERGGDPSTTGQSASTSATIKPSARVLRFMLSPDTDAGDYDVEIRSAANIAAVLKPLQIIPLQKTGHLPSLAYQLSSPALAAGSYAAAWRLHKTSAWHYGFFMVAQKVPLF